MKEGADPLQVAEELRSCGVTVGRRTDDGFVCWIDRKKWLCRLYPELVPLYQEDRRFWKEIRKRRRNGESVSDAEIEAHAKEFNKQFDAIMSKYERRKEN